MELESTLNLEEIQDSDNVNDLLSEKDSDEIGRHVCQTYETDKQSRMSWEEKMESAIELALQVTKAKHWPWENASNVKFPLLTIAALQFQSRAYPALVKVPQVVKMRQAGNDPDGKKASLAARISMHMSYQLLEQDEGWEEDQDKAFLALPILGCVFKKSYYDTVKGHNCSQLVLPTDLVVHYYAKSIEDAERKTHCFQLYDRQVRERELRKIFTEHDYGPEKKKLPKKDDARQGLTPPVGDKDRPREFLEQHTYLDLDGDGYKEPYVVTVHEGTKKVSRIVARFKSITTEQSVKIEDIQERMKALAEGVQPPQQGQPIPPQELARVRQVEATLQSMQAEIERLTEEKPKVLKIEPLEYFTKYSFIPSPDGGFYDLGFGSLLGPLNDSVNTLVNQLIDSGTLQNNGGGFIGAGVRVKGGRLNFKPNEWKRVQASGGSLKENIVPLPVNEPSAVLFNMLSLLINYAERVASVNEAMMGENPGQNTPAYNYSAMLEQGLQVFNGIFKRIYRSFRGEIRKLYNLNAIYMDRKEYFEYLDVEREVARSDYQLDSKDLIPAADPNAFSNKEKLMKAQAVAERAQMTPGYNPIEVERRLLSSLDIPDIDEIYPIQDGPNGPELVFKPGPNPEFELKRAEEQRKTLETQTKQTRENAVADAEIMLKEAQAMKALADARSTAEEPDIKRMQMLVDEISDRRKALVEAAKIENANNQRSSEGMEG